MRAHYVAVRPNTGNQDASAVLGGRLGDDIDGVREGYGQVSRLGDRHVEHAR